MLQTSFPRWSRGPKYPWSTTDHDQGSQPYCRIETKKETPKLAVGNWLLWLSFKGPTGCHRDTAQAPMSGTVSPAVCLSGSCLPSCFNLGTTPRSIFAKTGIERASVPGLGRRRRTVPWLLISMTTHCADLVTAVQDIRRDKN